MKLSTDETREMMVGGVRTVVSASIDFVI